MIDSDPIPYLFITMCCLFNLNNAGITDLALVDQGSSMATPVLCSTDRPELK